MLLCGVFFALFNVYKETFYTPHKNQGNDLYLSSSMNYQGHNEEALEMIKNLQSIPCETVYTKSYDGLKLCGYVYPKNGSNKVAIMCHGYRGTPRRDFSGGAVEMMKAGMNVLLIDERGHGKSEGHSITFGVREQKDVLSWIDFVKQRFGDKVEIVLVGISMGGATVLFSADKVDDNIKIIADCPYSSPKDIISSTLEKLQMPPKFFYPIANLVSILFCHTNLNKTSALKTIKNSNHKILIIHGDSDTIVPHKLSEKIYLENKEKIRYELFPGADHGMCYLIDKQRYQKVVKEFLEE